MNSRHRELEQVKPTSASAPTLRSKYDAKNTQKPLRILIRKRCSAQMFQGYCFMDEAVAIRIKVVTDLRQDKEFSPNLDSKRFFLLLRSG